MSSDSSIIEIMESINDQNEQISLKKILDEAILLTKINHDNCLRIHGATINTEQNRVAIVLDHRCVN